MPGPSTPGDARDPPTAPSPVLTGPQRRVLVALCRPLTEGTGATPATNRQIAAELSVSVDAVKSQLRVLCGRFAVGPLPQNEKRMRLALIAIAAGAVRDPAPAADFLTVTPCATDNLSASD